MSDESFYSKEDRPWLSERLTTGSIVGHTTTTSVRLWLRVLAPGDYELVVRPHEPIPTERVDLRTRGGRRVAIDSRSKRVLADCSVHPISFRYARDLTRVEELTGLAPGTRYYYALRRARVRNALSWEWELGYGEPRCFRTFDADPDEVNFGLFSCHMPFDSDIDRPLPVNLELWAHFQELLLDARASLVIGGGDQVYSDGHEGVSIWRWLRKVKNKRLSRDDMLSWYRDIYRGYWGMGVVQEVFRSFPTYMIWGDHEIKDGWGSYSRKELSDELDGWFEWEKPKRNLALADRMWEAAQQVYDEYQHSHNPDPPRERDAGGARNWHYHFRCGPCGYFVLDMRGHRYYRSDADAEILGAEQLADLKAWLETGSDDCQVLFVVASVPVVHASSFVVNWLDLPFSSLKDDLRDHWEHESHLDEREALLRLVFADSQARKRRVVFLSGDVHVFYDLYGKSEIPGGITRLQRLVLD